jgi:hypothetical protein
MTILRFYKNQSKKLFMEEQKEGLVPQTVQKAAQKQTSIVPYFVLLLSLPFVVFFSLSQQKTQERAATSIPSSVLATEQSILDNIKQNGYDANTPGGGLWVNWRYGSSPLQTNFDGTGTPYPGGLGTNHDPLTDIRYIHNLWLYKSQNPTDTRYDSEIARYTLIVKAEWANATNQRGWLFDEEFMDTYQASKDSFYQATAMNLAAGYAKAINPSVGIMYKTSATHPQGYYRPADVLEAGCALIQAGTLSHNASWTQLGQTAVNFVYAHAYIPQYHTFGQDMDQVLTTSGAVNPTEIFYMDTYQNHTIQGNEMRTGEISQMILSLLFTYKVTHTQDYLNKAEDLLNALSLPANPLGMWDSANLGYLQGVLFTGTSPQQPGTTSLVAGKKEAGRQVTLLWAFHLANQLTNNQYQTMENQMLQVALTKSYYAPGHGVLYEVNANWSPLNFSNGQLNDAVTTEAMGAELEGLLSLGSVSATPSGSISQAPIATPTVAPAVSNPTPTF